MPERSDADHVRTLLPTNAQPVGEVMVSTGAFRSIFTTRDLVISVLPATSTE